MAQFDVYRFAPRGAGFTLVVDVQNKLLDGLATRVVAPLYPLQAKDKPILRLNPVTVIEGRRYYLAIQEMSALRVKALGAAVTSLEAQRDEIVAAIDFLITGV
ncbi:MAG: CcdB family protein [Rhodomicrobium sp.]